jgi:uncharacterized protein (TIGR00369 family)
MTRADERAVVAPTDWGLPHQRTITWFDPHGLAQASGRTGLEQLEAIRDGILPPAPMASVYGFRITELARGRVGFACEPDESAYNPLGVVHGGLVCTLADTVTGCAVHSTLPAGIAYTSIDLSVSYLRAVTAHSGELLAIGTATKVGRRVGFAEAVITDGTGREVATATSSLLVFDAPG